MSSCIVIGPPKSATTLMISLLDSHPGLAVIPLEVKFYDHFYSFFKGKATYEVLNDFFLNKSKITLIKQHNTDLLDPMNTGHVNFTNVDFSVIEKEMRKKCRNKDSGCIGRSTVGRYIVDFYQAYSAASGYFGLKGFAIKEGNHVLPYVNNIMSDFPGAKFVVMVRRSQGYVRLIKGNWQAQS